MIDRGYMADTGLTSVLFLAVTVGIDHALEKKGIMRPFYGKKVPRRTFPFASLLSTRLHFGFPDFTPLWQRPSKLRC